nr:MAG TPA: hypothetical protein [Caudoviricetes sp.]
MGWFVFFGRFGGMKNSSYLCSVRGEQKNLHEQLSNN